VGNAVWLWLALPPWYFHSILAPFAGGSLTMVPALGVVCLGIGTLAGVIRRRTGLLLLLIPVVGSHVLVAVAGLFRGKVSGALSQPILLAFLALELLVSAYLIYRLKSARIEASILSVFVITYALFATFIATMAFGDNWL
jgi:hypothetical protein